MMSPLQIERSLSVHSGSTGKDFFILEKFGEIDDMKSRRVDADASVTH